MSARRKGVDVKDYRWPTRAPGGRHPVEQLIAEAKAEGRDPANWEEGHVRGPLPPDRKGLIAAFHAQCMLAEDHVAQVNGMARAIAMRTKQPVFIVMTESRWHLLLFGFEGKDGIDYDGNENGEYANDQFIGYYEADGSWTFVGCS